MTAGALLLLPLLSVIIELKAALLALALVVMLVVVMFGIM